jgi:hypothetical protein
MPVGGPLGNRPGMKLKRADQSPPCGPTISGQDRQRSIITELADAFLAPSVVEKMEVKRREDSETFRLSPRETPLVRRPLSRS